MRISRRIQIATNRRLTMMVAWSAGELAMVQHGSGDRSGSGGSCGSSGSVVVVQLWVL